MNAVAPRGASLHPTDQTNISPSALSKQGPDLAPTAAGWLHLWEQKTSASGSPKPVSTRIFDPPKCQASILVAGLLSIRRCMDK